MYICLCRAVTDRQIRESVENGASSFREVREELDVGTCCGRCVPETRELIDQALSEIAGRISVAA
ncbi:regulatory or redox protein complexing with Bfr in iron storage and mobility (BFD) [Alkanindiges hydrocarboniclasticus]|jgi:bacterioferritin-associated ferredoxin|uniref:Bacterioferritin-associated ferredoxin n=1 Tax=Alkanindiges hydrocarboniclasticus TaxID=1907941 RepID=A0A1S8CSU9_9GAMM|nr:bacterioferritin-associated ferredoxin [Alkanindiges hydrocarboniclasticus]ONG38719.1 regulatory or redox protein complexing with Bfr in iron storage and mobility (BFD) [Alkanindiges hydrocarboniclasticus]